MSAVEVSKSTTVGPECVTQLRHKTKTTKFYGCDRHPLRKWINPLKKFMKSWIMEGNEYNGSRTKGRKRLNKEPPSKENLEIKNSEIWTRTSDQNLITIVKEIEKRIADIKDTRETMDTLVKENVNSRTF